MGIGGEFEEPIAHSCTTSRVRGRLLLGCPVHVGRMIFLVTLRG